MKRSDVTTRMVLTAVADHGFYAMSVLTERYPRKVVERAFEREVARGNLNYGVSLRRSWLEPKGRTLLFRADYVPIVGDLVQHCNARTEYELIKHPYRPDECAECSRLRNVLRGASGNDWPCNE